MTERTIVLLNARSRGGGAAKLEAAIRAAFGAKAYPITIRRVRRRLNLAATDALQEGYTTIVAAGGDGTIRTVAAAVAQAKAVLGVIPVGTFNHFAKDAGLPLDIPEAVAVIVRGHHRQVDCACVNGRFFVNSAAMGVHPLFVRRRLVYEQQVGKWLAIPIALAQAVIRLSSWRLTLTINKQRQDHRTPFVFIGNNDYQVEQLGLPRRAHLRGGRLYVYVLTCQTRRQLAWIWLRSLWGGLSNERYFEAFSSDKCIVESKRPIQLTLDGELIQLKSPLVFKSHPGGLTILSD